jgi:hypothetical protein
VPSMIGSPPRMFSSAVTQQRSVVVAIQSDFFKKESSLALNLELVPVNYSFDLIAVTEYSSIYPLLAACRLAFYYFFSLLLSYELFHCLVL